MDYNNILVEAKTELTNQFINLLTPNIYDGFQLMYVNVIDECNKKHTNEYLTEFQLSLKDIPNWSSTAVKNEYIRISNRCDCDYLDDLLTGVLVSTARVLSSIGTKNTKVNLKIPKIYKFIHQCYIHAAREFWKFTYLFDNNIPKTEIQRNIRESEKIIENSIKSTIRFSLPVQNMLKEYLINTKEDEDGDLDEDISKIYKDNLRQMLKNNLESIPMNSHNDNYNMKMNDSDPELNVEIESIKPLNKYMESTKADLLEHHKKSQEYIESTKFDYSSDDKILNKLPSHSKQLHVKKSDYIETLDDDINITTKATANILEDETDEYDKKDNRKLSSSHNHSKDIKQIKIQSTKLVPNNTKRVPPKPTKEDAIYYDIDIDNSDDSFIELDDGKTKNTNLEELFKKI